MPSSSSSLFTGLVSPSLSLFFSLYLCPIRFNRDLTTISLSFLFINSVGSRPIILARRSRQTLFRPWHTRARARCSRTSEIAFSSISRPGSPSPRKQIGFWLSSFSDDGCRSATHHMNKRDRRTGSLTRSRCFEHR